MFRGGGELWLSAGFCAGVWQRLVGVAHTRGCPPLFRVVLCILSQPQMDLQATSVVPGAVFCSIRRFKRQNGRPEVRKMHFL